MNEDEAALLAELRAISEKSASSSRFGGAGAGGGGGAGRADAADDHEVVEGAAAGGSFPPDNDDAVAPDATSSASPGPAPAPAAEPAPTTTADDGNEKDVGDENNKPIPPWKRRGGAAAAAAKTAFDVDVVAAAPPPPPEPKARAQAVVVDDEEAAAAASSDAAKPNTTAPEDSARKEEAPTTAAYVASSASAAFSGEERGGSAEDAELLALLRGVSNKSSGAGRFDDDGTGDNNNTNDGTGGGGGGDASNRKEKEGEKLGAAAADGEGGASGGSAAAAGSSDRTDGTKSELKEADQKLPPWKRWGSKFMAARNQPEVDVVVVAAAPPPEKTAEAATAAGAATEEPKGSEADVASARRPKYGIKSDVRSTFTGERGGAAEDEELLALLRGVSSKSSSRFNDGIGGDHHVAATDKLESNATPVPDSQSAEEEITIDAVDAVEPTDAVSVIQPDAEAPSSELQNPPPSAFGIKSDMPSTFSGERGGAAEDAELLALLRGVSTQSSSASRFGNGDDAQPDAAPTKIEQPPRASAPVTLGAPPAPGPSIPVSAPAGKIDDDAVTKDDLPDAMTDKNWKIRRKAFDLLKQLLTDMVKDDETNWNVDANTLVEGLDGLVPKIVEDSNVNALDGALGFALVYAEHCSGAGDADNARAIASSLVKKNGLTSRPTTSKLASSLIFKLIEVGTEGVSSAHAVIEVLLKEGLASRKPKVVQASSSLVLEAAYEFGATTLPLALIKSSVPLMLSNANASVRNTGVNILAEICRALGSKTPINDVIEDMKNAQVAELDALLSKQPDATPARTQLRSQKNPSSNAANAASGSAEDAIAALEADAKELEAARFAARPAVDLIAAVSKTDYASRIELTKWSEKVAALNTILECGGEKPYKLAQPSPSVNYLPLISDMKKLLGHTHFAVVGKAMEVLSMLAEGVGEKLYSFMRPLLSPLLKLSKDKKLTRSVGNCLDAFFGNVLGFTHLLDPDDALPTALDESKQKNALARTFALEFLTRCVQRSETAGPRGTLTAKLASDVATLCASKLDDSNADVRKAGMDTLRALLESPSPDVKKAGSDVVATLKQSNSRAFKALTKESGTVPNSAPISVRDGRANAKSCVPQSSAPPGRRAAEHPGTSSAGMKRPPSTGLALSENIGPAATTKSQLVSGDAAVSLETALTRCSALHIAQWDAPDDDGGILSGLKSSKWMLRQDAVKSITAFVESGQMSDSKNVEMDTSSLLVVVGEHTRGFKETNVNIMKAVVHLFIALSEFHETIEKPLGSWAMKSGVAAAVSKIADKKLSSVCKSLLTELCVVSLPHTVVTEGFACLKSARSPIVHEEYLGWFMSFCDDFGAASLGSGLTDIIPFLLEELDFSSVKVKRAAISCIGAIHAHIGPQFKALSLSLAKPNHRNELESCFNDHPFDESLQASDWPKRCLSVLNLSSTNGNGAAKPGMSLSIPRCDLSAELPEDCIARLGSKDGKASWKIRKEALDDVDVVLKRCNGLLDVSGPRMKHLVAVTRALRDRLTDTQINLKPLAARVIGSLLSAVDKSTQAKLGKLVFAPLINATMNDIKKTMRDAALGAIQAGTTESSLDGGGVNGEALEEFVAAMVAEVNERSSKAGGLPEVLLFLVNVVEYLPKLDDSLGDKYAAVIVECLTSSKSETRAAATSLLNCSFEKGVIEMESIRKATERLKPAKQRPVMAQITKLSRQVAASEKAEKENDEPVRPVAPTNGRSRVPSANVTATPTSHRPSQTKANEGPVAQPGSASSPGSPESISRHPLILRGGHSSRGPHRNVIWPEYPEEPQGVSLLNNLKKGWSALIPQVTMAALFPSSGIKKQDDAKAGLELLTQALEIDRSEGGDEVIRQSDFILKWLVFVLCSRETSVGLVALLAFTKDLFSIFVERNRQLTDNEALILHPFLVDKCSVSKGRFHDMCMEIVSMNKLEELLSEKSIGSTVCVAVMERSPHAKARALASRMAFDCLEKEGLAGIGKKGVLVAAKSLSEETVAENKAASLDLLELVLSKMNGDVQRLERICGPSLSDKARQLLVERWSKRERKETGGHTGTPARSSPTSWKSPAPSTLASASARNVAIASVDTDTPNIYDELPSFSLRTVSRDSASPSSQQDGTGGGAAALRARLMKIRENSKAFGPADETGQHIFASASAESQDVESIFAEGVDSLRGILSEHAPLNEDNERLSECIETLKRFHAALSRQQSPVAGLSAMDLLRLRDVIGNHLNETIECLTRLIRFALDCGDPSVNAGMSIPLLSVCLATLMAFFRDLELAPSVSQDYLTLLIRETGTALLNPLLTATSDLDEATRSQMVRAINKLAVQAATGAARHEAFSSLLSLQHQLSLESESETSEELNRRLSRVLAKLFARVIKAEEAMPEPFSTDTVDMESTVCVMEDALSGCRDAEKRSPGHSHFAVEACHQMVKDLAGSILQAYEASTILALMDDLGIDPDQSPLASVIRSIDADVSMESIVPGVENPPLSVKKVSQTVPTTPRLREAQTASVANLVSALANAPQGEERDNALDALRNYTAANGDEELVEHLQQVSSPFRAFIEKQLQSAEVESGDGRPDASRVRQPVESGRASSMTERLRNLRSRLEASEVVVQDSAEDKPAIPPSPSVTVPSPVTLSKTPSPRPSPPSPARASKLAKPTPSKIPAPGASSSYMRDRMAASQELRKTASNDSGTTQSSSASMGRAAALR